MREFSAAELEKATNGFSNVIGKGGFGIVYKGVYDHSHIAVKVLTVNVSSYNNNM